MHSEFEELANRVTSDVKRCYTRTDMNSPTAPAPTSDRAFYIFNAIVSAAALIFLAWLLVLREKAIGSGGTIDLRFMPALNATLNACSALCLMGGFIAVRRKNVKLHRSLMIAAFAMSALFLVGYIAYHSVHGDTKFGGVGSIRLVYFSTLISHILLSTVIVPMALAALYFALIRKDFRKHTRVTRILFPIWLYVSITGVALYFMLSPYYPAGS